MVIGDQGKGGKDMSLMRRLQQGGGTGSGDGGGSDGTGECDSGVTSSDAAKSTMAKTKVKPPKAKGKIKNKISTSCGGGNNKAEKANKLRTNKPPVTTLSNVNKSKRSSSISTVVIESTSSVLPLI